MSLVLEENGNIKLKWISIITVRERSTALSFAHHVPNPQLLPLRPPFLQSPSPEPRVRGESVGLGLGGARQTLHPGLQGIECQQFCVAGGMKRGDLSRGALTTNSMPFNLLGQLL